MAPAFRSYGENIRPRRFLKDCGGGGNCGPLVLDMLLQRLGLLSSAQSCRSMVVDHGAALVREDLLLRMPTRDGEPLMSASQYFAHCVGSWPQSVRQGLPLAASTWLELMRQDGTWADEGFLVAAADLFEVRISLTVLDLTHAPEPSFVLPRDGVDPRYEVEMVLWSQHHFVAVLDCPVLGGQHDLQSGCLHASPTPLQPLDEDNELRAALQISERLAEHLSAGAHSEDEVRSLASALSNDLHADQCGSQFAASEVAEALQKSTELSEHLASAARSEEEVDGIASAIAMDAASTPGTVVLAAMTASVETAQREADLRATLAVDHATALLDSLQPPLDQSRPIPRGGTSGDLPDYDTSAYEHYVEQHELEQAPPAPAGGSSSQASEPANLAVERASPPAVPPPPHGMTPAQLLAKWNALPDRPHPVVLFYDENQVNGWYSNFWIHPDPWYFVLPPWCNAAAIQAAGLPAAFEVNCGEIAVMACKAAVFADFESFRSILAADSPARAKQLGRSVANFDQARWDTLVCSIALEVTSAKAAADSLVATALRASDNSLIAEAAPNDTVWGIGLPADNPRALNPRQWRGSNVLGWAWMHEREQAHSRPPPPRPPIPVQDYSEADVAYALQGSNPPGKRLSKRPLPHPGAGSSQSHGASSKRRVTFSSTMEEFAAPGRWSPPPRGAAAPGESSMHPAEAANALVAISRESSSAEPPSADDAPFTFPLRTVAEVVRLLASPQAPTVLVAMEFSGAMRTALAQRGIRALSVDFRESETDGMHYVGDVRDVVHLTYWDAAYFFPSCTQIVRFDKCLDLKICDGRSFWGCAVVLWCLCCPYARVVCVEQPDTIVYDGFKPHGVRFYAFRTSELGDPDKFVRLAVRGATLPLTSSAAQPQPDRGDPPRHLAHANADARDRARSTWRPFTNTASQLTQLTLEPLCPLDYAACITAFAVLWADAGRPVPVDFANSDAQPADSDDRAYVLVRGAGDGRILRAVHHFGDAVIGGDLLPAGWLSPPASEAGDLDASACDLDVFGDVNDGVEAPADSCGSSDPRSVESGDPATGASWPPRASIMDIRRAGETASILLLVCVLAQPLVFAHLNGFSVIGADFPPPSSRAGGVTWAQSMASLAGHTLTYAFMVGRYVAGASLFTAPIGREIDASTIISSAADRQDALSRGVQWAWCTPSSLRGTSVADAVTRVFLATASFAGPTTQLASTSAAGAMSGFLFGASAPTELARQPMLSNRGAAGLGALAASLADERSLAALISDTAAPYLEGWLERIAPLPGDALPADLLGQLPNFEDSSLDGVALSPIREPLRTPWVPLPPPQKSPGPGAPACPASAADLLTDEAVHRLRLWLRSQLEDLLSLRAQLAAGVPAANVDRSKRPQPIAIGQGEVKPFARGIVWDCRRLHDACCVPLDFHARLETHLNLPVIEQRLAAYPDQTLVANLLEGVRLDADVELQMVLVPHLMSLPNGLGSVEKELRRQHGNGWYDFFADLPFFPMYMNAQGATARKLEPDRWRRTTEGGGPRKPTFDADGLRALSINEASHIHHMPRHFQDDHRPEMRAWLQMRGLPRGQAEPGVSTTWNPHAWGAWPVPEAVAQPGWQPHSKWPKEAKPRITELMRDVAVLRRAASRLGEPIYIFGDDAKDYFNQLAIAAPDLYKLGIVFLAHDGELPAEPQVGPHVPTLEGQRLLFISEKRLGFGTHGASNIAQRLSNALLDMFRDRLDELEEAARGDESSAALEEYLAERLEVQRASGVPCHRTRRYEKDPAGGVQVCPQQRLYASYMYTDDKVTAVVGRRRALRALRAWRETVDELNLLMAIPEKRTLGTWTIWLGILIVVSLGVVAVPKDKLVRAAVVVSALLANERVVFSEYRRLCGLLEHCRAVNLRGRNVMHGLYEPHRPDGASKHGPEGVVTCSLLMRKQLIRWTSLLHQASGRAVTAVLKRSEVEPHPDLFFDLYSDACLEVEGSLAGIGGFCHGAYWTYQPDLESAKALSIGALELLGIVLNILTFAKQLGPTLRLNPNARLVLRTDALTSALTLPAETQDSPIFVAIYQWLREQPAFTLLEAYLVVAHCYGEANPVADALSRFRWDDFQRWCVQLNVRPHEVQLAPEVAEVVAVGLTAARLSRRRGGMHGAAVLHAASPSAFLSRRRRELGLVPPSAASPEQSAITGIPVQGPAARRPGSAFLLRRSTETAVVPAGAAPQPSSQQAQQPSPPPHDPPGGQAKRLRTTAERVSVAPGSRAVGSLRLPMLTVIPRESALARASTHYAQARALALTAVGEPDMQLRADITSVMGVGAAVDEAVDIGVNANTASKDTRAWDFWEHVCEQQGTSPLRTAQDARDYPERQSHLLAALMLYAFAVCKPTDTRREFIKPRSALAYPLAIIRIFGRWGIVLPGYKALVAALSGLMRAYLLYHGPYSLAPKRAEPMRFSMVGAIDAIPDGAQVDGIRWNHSDHDVFMFRCLNLFLIVTAFRLGEIVEHTSGELMYLTRDSITWHIRGLVLTDPTWAQLAEMRPGLDFARARPPRSKPDQWGEIHCPFPATITYYDEPGNAAAALREIERRVPCRGEARRTTPLFADRNHRPYSHGRLGRLLRAALTHLYGKAAASLFTFHSYRSGLATALHAAGVEDGMVQLICRWMCPESLHVYRRVGATEHDQHIRAAQSPALVIDAMQAVNTPRVAADHGYAQLMESCHGTLSLTATQDFEDARVTTPRQAGRATPAGGARRRLAAARERSPAATSADPLPPPVPTAPPSLVDLEVRPEVGSAVFIPNWCWPTYECLEYAGEGWSATVKTRTRYTVVVSFDHAKTAQGASYADERLDWRVLKGFA